MESSILMIQRYWNSMLEQNKLIRLNMGKINKKMSFRVPTEKPKKQDLELAMRLPMEYIPDPRTIIEDAQDKEKEDRDAEDRRKVIETANSFPRELKKSEW